MKVLLTFVDGADVSKESSMGQSAQFRLFCRVTVVESCLAFVVSLFSFNVVVSEQMKTSSDTLRDDVDKGDICAFSD